VVRWANQAWMSAETTAPVIAAALVGSNFLELAAADAGPFSAAMIGAITAVLAGETSYVELHSEADAHRPVKIAITPLRGGRGGVVVHSEPIGGRAATAGASLLIDAARIAERLTPRELEVLTRMAAGLSNRVIAGDLGIEYTTVRGYVQSVLSKLGARSRVDAVARAYRSGLVRETES
jgi:DNA-binding NarL/FixJ family response regulator